jgi:hypothetical protein
MCLICGILLVMLSKTSQFLGVLRRALAEFEEDDVGQHKIPFNGFAVYCASIGEVNS